MISDKVFSKAVPARLAWLVKQLPLWITLALLLAALVNALGVISGSLPAWVEGLLDHLSNFSAVFLGIFIEAAPFLLLGTLGSGIVEVFLDRGDLVRWIPRQPLLGALTGSLIGLFFPVCECGVVPFTRRLIYKGVPVPVAIATLMAAPVLNPIVIASTLAAFGPGPVFWGRMGLSLLIATLTGLAFSAIPNPGMLLRGTATILPEMPLLAMPSLAMPSQGISAPSPRTPFRERARQALLISADEFFEMGRFLILGALLAALMQTFTRQSALLGIGQGPVLSVVVMLILAVLLSVCSTVDAFIALAFTGTFTGGAVLAFLVFGPMVDIKSTLMFLRVFRPRAVAYLVLLPMVMTLAATVFLNYFFPWQ